MIRDDRTVCGGNRDGRRRTRGPYDGRCGAGSRRGVGIGGVQGDPVRRTTRRSTAVRGAGARAELGRRTEGGRVRDAASAVRRVRHGRTGVRRRGGRRGLADPQCLDTRPRPRRGAAGDRVDARRRVRHRDVGPARVRRRPAGAGGCRRRGDAQLPGRHRGVRADRGSARQPGPARPGGRAGVGAGQHPRLRRRSGPRHGRRPVGGRGFAGRAARDATRGRALRPGRRPERARYVLLDRARRRHRPGVRRGAGRAPDGGGAGGGGAATAARGGGRGRREGRGVRGAVGADGPRADPGRARRRRRGAAGRPLGGAGRRHGTGRRTRGRPHP